MNWAVISPPCFFAFLKYVLYVANLEEIEKVNLTAATRFMKSLGGWPVLGSSMGGNWREADYSLLNLLVEIRKYSNSPAIFDMYVYDDAKNPTDNILYVSNMYIFLDLV